MADIESGYLGAVTHAVLAAVAAVEGAQFKSRIGKLAAGCAFGWHVHAVYYHLTHPRDRAIMEMSKETR
jgi:hypothetical protein